MSVPTKDEIYSKRGYSLLENIDNLGARSVLWRLRATVSFYGAMYGAAAMFGMWFMTTDSVHLSTDSNPIDFRVKTRLSTQSVLLVNRWTGTETMKEIHKAEGSAPNVDARQTLWVSRLLYRHFPYLGATDLTVRVNVSEELLPYRYAVGDADMSRLGHRHVSSVRSVDEHGGVQYKMQKKRDDAYDAEVVLSQRLAKRAATDQRPPPVEVVAQYRIRPLTSESHVVGTRPMVQHALDTAIREEVESRYRRWIVEHKSEGRQPVLAAEMMRYGTVNGEGVRAADIVGEEGTETFQSFGAAVTERAVNKLGRKMFLESCSYHIVQK